MVHYQATAERRRKEDVEEDESDSNGENPEFAPDVVIDPQLLGRTTSPQDEPRQAEEAPNAPETPRAPFALLMNSPTPSPTRPSFNDIQLIAEHQARRPPVATNSDKEDAAPPATQSSVSNQAKPQCIGECNLKGRYIDNQTYSCKENIRGQAI